MFPYKEEKPISTPVRIIIFLFVFMLFLRFLDYGIDRNSTIDANFDELYYLIECKDEEIQELKEELGELRRDYEDLQYLIWDVMDYINY